MDETKNSWELSQEEKDVVDEQRVITAEMLKEKAPAFLYLTDPESGVRLEVTQDEFLEIHKTVLSKYDTRQAEKEKKKLEEIEAEIKTKPMSQFIEEIPEFKDSIEVIKLNTEGTPIILVRDKNLPGLAYLVADNYKGSTQGSFFLNIPDSRIEKGVAHKSVGFYCACCRFEAYDLDKLSPFVSGRPIYSYKKEGESNDDWQNRYNKYKDEYKAWTESEEGKKHEEWLKNKNLEVRTEMMTAIRNAVDKMGIQYIVLRKAHKWEEWDEKENGPRMPKRVEFLEIGDGGDIKVKNRVKEFRKFAGVEERPIPLFEISS